MALIALIRRRALPGGRRAKLVLAALGIFGASLFFGDSMITPAISVLSAVEGVKVAAPSAVGPGRPDHGGDHRRACSWLQRLGTGAVGRLFGPVMVVWFTVHRRARGPRHRRPSGDPEGAVARPTRVGFLAGHFGDRVLLAGRGRPRRHRRRGAVRRHGALRPLADHAGLAAAGLPGLHPELPGPGRPVLDHPAQRPAARSSCWPRAGPGSRWWSSRRRPRSSPRRR